MILLRKMTRKDIHTEPPKLSNSRKDTQQHERVASMHGEPTYRSLTYAKGACWACCMLYDDINFLAVIKCLCHWCLLRSHLLLCAARERVRFRFAFSFFSSFVVFVCLQHSIAFGHTKNFRSISSSCCDKKQTGSDKDSAMAKECVRTHTNERLKESSNCQRNPRRRHRFDASMAF